MRVIALDAGETTSYGARLVVEYCVAEKSEKRHFQDPILFWSTARQGTFHDRRLVLASMTMQGLDFVHIKAASVVSRKLSAYVS
jgi:hypothetical protein